MVGLTTYYAAVRLELCNHNLLVYLNVCRSTFPDLDIGYFGLIGLYKGFCDHNFVYEKNIEHCLASINLWTKTSGVA